MKSYRQTLRRYVTAVVVLSCLILLITASVFIDGSNDELALRNSSVFAASNDRYDLSAPIQLHGAPAISLISGTLSIPPASAGLARSGEVLAMLITGRQSRIALNDAQFSVDLASKEDGLSQGMADALAPLVANLRGLRFDLLSVHDSTIRIRMGDGTTLRLTDVMADISSDPDGAIRADGSFAFRGETVSFDTTYGPGLDADQNTHLIKASIESPLLTARFDGHLSTGTNPRLLSQQAELDIPMVRDAARWLGAKWPPGRSLVDFHASGLLEWANGTLAFQDATIEMDGNRANGTLSANFRKERPSIDGTLGLETLDLTSYFAAEEAAEETSSSDLLSIVGRANSLDFPFIKTVDADLRLSANRVIGPGFTIGRSAATVSLKNGRMLADVAELELAEGMRGEGQLRIDVTGQVPSYDIRGKLEALDLGRAAKAVFGHATVQGTGDATIDLSAKGDTGKTVLSSLDGKLYVALENGGRLGINIDQLSAAAKTPEVGGIWSEASNTAMPVDHLDAKFELSGGVIRTENAQATSGERAVAAEGAISLPERAFDLSLVIGDRPPEDAAEGTGPEPREVIDMHGPWADPKLEPGPIPRTGTPPHERSAP